MSKFHIRFSNVVTHWPKSFCIASTVLGCPYENIEKIETSISEIFKMLGYDLFFLTYKLPNFGQFE